MRLRSLVFVVLLPSAGVAGLIGSASCGDPVHEAEVNALGPEAPGVPQGPTHRPGQPCLTCHGGLGPGDPTFVTAGTVYTYGYGNDGGAAVAAVVNLVDSTGSAFTATTNQVGNFYVTGDQWSPVFPLGGRPGDAGPDVQPIAIGIAAPACAAGTPPTSCPGAQQMMSAIDRGGVYASCAYCHFDPPGPTSTGHLYQRSAP